MTFQLATRSAKTAVTQSTLTESDFTADLSAKGAITLAVDITDKVNRVDAAALAESLQGLSQAQSQGMVEKMGLVSHGFNADILSNVISTGSLEALANESSATSKLRGHESADMQLPPGAQKVGESKVTWTQGESGDDLTYVNTRQEYVDPATGEHYTVNTAVTTEINRGNEKDTVITTTETFTRNSKTGTVIEKEQEVSFKPGTKDDQCEDLATVGITGAVSGISGFLAGAAKGSVAGPAAAVAGGIVGAFTGYFLSKEVVKEICKIINPMDDQAYEDLGYEIDHPALSKNKYDYLIAFNPSIDYGDQHQGASPYSGPSLEEWMDALGGTSTGTWGNSKSSVNENLERLLLGFIDSDGGTSTGNDVPVI